MSFDEPARPGGAAHDRIHRRARARVRELAPTGAARSRVARRRRAVPAPRVQPPPRRARSTPARPARLVGARRRARLPRSRRARSSRRAAFSRRAPSRSASMPRGIAAWLRWPTSSRSSYGDLLSVPAALESPAAKRAAAAATRRRCRRHGVGGDRGCRGARARAVRGVARRRRRRRRRVAARRGTMDRRAWRMAHGGGAAAPSSSWRQWRPLLDAGRSVIASRAAFSTVSRTRWLRGGCSASRRRCCRRGANGMAHSDRRVARGVGERRALRARALAAVATLALGALAAYYAAGNLGVNTDTANMIAADDPVAAALQRVPRRVSAARPQSAHRRRRADAGPRRRIRRGVAARAARAARALPLAVARGRGRVLRAQRPAVSADGASSRRSRTGWRRRSR